VSLKELSVIRDKTLWESLNGFMLSNNQDLNPMLSTFLNRCEKEKWSYETLSDGVSIQISAI